MNQEGETVFGYQMGDGTYGPTPPPEIANFSAPLLSTAEYNDNRHFLDFFTSTAPDEAGFLESLGSISHDVLPQYQGMSSTFGRPDTFQFQGHDAAYHGSFTQSAKPNLFSDTDYYLPPQNPVPPTAHGSMLQKHGQNDTHHMIGANSHDVKPHGIPNHGQQVFEHIRTTYASQQAMLGFGSDASFASPHYAPPPGALLPAEIEGRVLQTLTSFKPAQSNSNTRPSSPNVPRKRNTLNGNEAPESENDAQVSNKRKRACTTAASEDNDTETVRARSNGTPKKTKEIAEQPENAVSVQRRKSKSAEAKRQNLTEQEKKNNHIRSEQKRRNQIKEGFASLHSMMPDDGPDSSSSSKCIILARAVEWLAGLRKGNEALKAQLQQLQESNV